MEVSWSLTPKQTEAYLLPAMKASDLDMHLTLKDIRDVTSDNQSPWEFAGLYSLSLPGHLEEG